MAGKILLIIFIVITGAGLPLMSGANKAEVGATAPPFHVEAGDGRMLTLDMLKGKVVALLYETRGVVKKNERLKQELEKFHYDQPDSVKKELIRLPIINCSSSPRPLRRIWQHKLREYSDSRGLVIYGDWDATMLNDYGFKNNESNFIIIDKKGIVRYSAIGKVEKERCEDILRLLGRLLREH
ncbi:MAG: hypothetical protein JXD19_11600 [Deltaproteobacteria bacterium]|nr:hypothetical protein [Deltaproteobacteria bacterium]